MIIAVVLATGLSAVRAQIDEDEKQAILQPVQELVSACARGDLDGFVKCMAFPCVLVDVAPGGAHAEEFSSAAELREYLHDFAIDWSDEAETKLLSAQIISARRGKAVVGARVLLDGERGTLAMVLTHFRSPADEGEWKSVLLSAVMD